MRKRLLFILIIFYLSTANAAGIKKKIAILNFNTKSTSEYILKTIRNSIELKIFKSQKFIVLERDKFNFILKERNVNQKCKSTSCVVEIGRVLSADLVITGNIDDKFNDPNKYSLIFKVLDVSTGRIVFIEELIFAKGDDILDKIDYITEKYLYGLNRPDTNSNNRITTYVKIKSGVLTPFTKLSTMCDTGYSGKILISIENLFIDRFSCGPETGLYYFPGKEGFQYFYMIPLTLSFHYLISVNIFEIVPSVSVGGIGIKYIYTDNSNAQGIEPLISGGLYLSYSINPNYNIFLLSIYNYIYEVGDVIHFLETGIGMKYNF